MGLPRILKNLMLFQNGTVWAGEVKELTLPKLARKLEEYRGAGMDSPVKVDMGGEAMELEWTMAGPRPDALAEFGGAIDGTYLRFSGAYEREDNGAIDAVDVYVRGRYEELELGSAKLGEVGDFKGKLALVYFRYEWNGAVLIEIDPLNMVFEVDGVDRLADLRAAIGI